MQRVFTTRIGRSPSAKPYLQKTVLTLTRRKGTRDLRLVGFQTRALLRTTTHEKAIPVQGHEAIRVEMLCGAELVVTVAANRLVTVLVAEEDDYRQWCKEEAEEFDDDEYYILSYPPCHVSKEEVRKETALHFYATSSGTFVVCLFNISSKKVRAKIEIEHWNKGEEECEMGDGALDS